MKKSELKNIIKECVKEVIFEEGVLSGIITEVVHGLGGGNVISESSSGKTNKQLNNKREQARKEVLAAIRKDSYEQAKKRLPNPELFEGTKPIADSSGRGALSGVSSNDSGVDISNLPGFVVMAASDEAELTHMIRTAAEYDEGPISFRYPRGEGVGLDLPERPGIIFDEIDTLMVNATSQRTPEAFLIALAVDETRFRQNWKISKSALTDAEAACYLSKYKDLQNAFGNNPLSTFLIAACTSSLSADTPL